MLNNDNIPESHDHTMCLLLTTVGLFMSKTSAELELEEEERLAEEERYLFVFHNTEPNLISMYEIVKSRITRVINCIFEYG